jgi:glycosyltransferase involved in cell wall biosynthesis
MSENIYEMKKIAVLCNYQLLPDRIGGMDHFFWQFDEAAKKAGYEVDWFFPNTAEQGGYKTLTIVASENPSVEKTFLRYIEHEQRKYDTVFCHFLELCTPFYKQVKKHLPNAQLIAVDHNPRPIEGYSLTKRISKRIKGLLFSTYIDTFVGVSQYTVNEIRSDFGKTAASKTIVIYNGIVTDSIQKRLNRSSIKPTFLTACHLRYSKGIQDLVEAVSLLPEPIRTDIHIDVYGDGPCAPDLKALVEQKKLNAQFTFKGNSPNLGSIYHCYDYLIHPSHMECFSLGILESLAANVPVITTSVGGNEEVVTHNLNGYIFPCKNTILLSKILKDLYTGEKRIHEDVSKPSRNQYTIGQMVEEYITLIN